MLANPKYSLSSLAEFSLSRLQISNTLCERKAADFMALLKSNYFDVLGLADEEHDNESKITNNLPNKAATPLPDAGKETQQQRQKTKPNAAMMRAKPIVGHTHNRFMVRETEIRRPKDKQNLDAVQNQQTVVESKILSLKEYEKELLEKKKVLNAVIKKPDGQQEEKVSLDKGFEWMKVIGKKKEEDVGRFMKPKSDKKKAAGEAKVHKVLVMDVSGFLKPLRSERSFAGNDRGKFNGRFSGQEDAPVAENGGTMKADPSPLNIEDHSQFPALK